MTEESRLPLAGLLVVELTRVRHLRFRRQLESSSAPTVPRRNIVTAGV